MKKLQIVSFLILDLSILLWTAGRIFFTLPGWAVRANGAVMLTAMSLLTFASIRLKVKNS